MTVNQVKDVMNTVTGEVLGKSEIVAEDLSNIVDIGTEVFNNNDVDNYVKSLVDAVGRVIISDRVYNGSVPSVMRDSWEYGAVVEKITADIPAAVENDSWNLVDGKSYDTQVFYKPSVSAKFFNSKVTFEIPMSFTELQVKESFSNASQLNAFVSMIYNAIAKSMTIKTDSLIQRTINNMIGQTVYKEFGEVENSDYSNSTGIKAVNLLKLYNDRFNQTLTAENAIYSPEFIRFAAFEMGLYKDRLAKISSLFNIGGKERFTPANDLTTVLLSDFVNAAGVYLESDTFHNDLVKLPTAETVAYWQGSGTDYSFSNVSDIHVNITDGTATHEIVLSGIIGVMFDRECLGVCNENQRTTTAYNAKAEFFNNYYKFDAGYYNDLNENFVVFFIA